MTASNTRVERDTFGPIEVPAERSPESRREPLHERADGLEVGLRPFDLVDHFDLGDRSRRLQPGELANPHLGKPAGLLELRPLLVTGAVAGAPHLRDGGGDLPGDLPVDRAALGHEQALQLAEERDGGECQPDFNRIDVHAPQLMRAPEPGGW